MMYDTLEKKKRTSLMTLVCVLAFFLSNISYLPYFTENGTTQLLSYPGWGLAFVAIFLHKQLFLSKRDLKILVFTGFMFILMGVFQLFTGQNYFSSLLTKCILIAIVLFVAGCMVSRTEKTWGQEWSCMYAYIIATVILCVIIVQNFLWDQDITSRFYSYKSKNETAFLAVSAVVMLLYLPGAYKWKKLRLIFRIGLIAFFTYVVIYMRCRSMMIAEAAVIAVFILQRNSSRKVKTLVLIALGAFVIVLQNDGIYQAFVKNILLAGRDMSNSDDLSSGRLAQISDGIKKFLQNPFVGTGDTKTVDCFYVSALMQYGAAVGSAFIFLAIYPVAWGVRNYKKIQSPVCIIMILCAMTYLIGGMFEENAPFGPGVRCYVSWFLFGYLRVQQSRGYFEVTNDEKDRVA